MEAFHLQRSQSLYPCQYRPVNPLFLQNIVQDVKDCADSLAAQSAEKIVRLDAPQSNLGQSWLGWSSEQDKQTRRVCQFPVLAEKTCNELIAEVENIKMYFQNAPLDHDGIVLNKFGFSRRMHYFAKLLAPLLRQVYQLPEGCIVQTTQALVVKYTPGDSHRMHVDDSTYTLNICLGQAFEGGRLCFFASDAAKVTPDEQATMQPELAAKHIPGHGILHNGNIPHSALKLDSGTRYNLVLWFSVHSTLNFEKVPWDVRRVVIARLSLPDLVNFYSSSKTYREHCRRDQSLWRYHYRCRFPAFYPNFPNDTREQEGSFDIRKKPTPTPTLRRGDISSRTPPSPSPNQPRGGMPSNPKLKMNPPRVNRNFEFQLRDPTTISSQPQVSTTTLNYNGLLSDQTLSPLFHYPILERGRVVIDANEEERISNHTLGRDWYMFLVDAVYLERRNSKTFVEMYYGAQPTHRDVSVRGLPESLKSVRSHSSSPGTAQQTTYNCTKTKPKVEYDGPQRPHFNPYMMSKRGPPTGRHVYYDEGTISALEVAEFYEVSGWEESVDFGKPENRISYGTVTNNNS